MTNLIVTQATLVKQKTPTGSRLLWVVTAQIQTDGVTVGGQVQLQFATAPGALPPYTVDDVLTVDKAPAPAA